MDRQLDGPNGPIRFKIWHDGTRIGQAKRSLGIQSHLYYNIKISEWSVDDNKDSNTF